MAGSFRKDKTTGAQTALNAAGVVTAQLVATGVVKTTGAAVKALGELFDAGFEKVAPVTDADNALFAEVEKAAPKADPKAKSKTTSKSKDDDGPTFKGDADEAAAMEFNSGKFKGLSIKEVDDLDEEDASAYDYNGPGSEYLDFIGSDKNKNPYTRSAVRIYRGE